MMHFCISVLGKTASIALENPLNPSTQAIRISSTPRFTDGSEWFGRAAFLAVGFLNYEIVIFTQLHVSSLIKKPIAQTLSVHSIGLFKVILIFVVLLFFHWNHFAMTCVNVLNQHFFCNYRYVSVIPHCFPLDKVQRDWSSL
jgi:hypothetical protein